MIHSPKFSVVMPVYNVEKYISNAIKSIVNQTIGFEKNIQLIIVNDGSTDNSTQICKKYKKKYPNNIIYIEQKNSGVSAARNNGLNYATGQYINFFDSDDIWSLDAFEKAYLFYKEHKDLDFDIIACRIKMFEATNKYHMLDYKFEYGDRIIDILKHPDFIQLSMATCFVKRIALEGKMFDTSLSISEDAKFIADIIIKKKLYGVLKSAVYHYRKRHTKNSAINLSNQNPSYYLPWIKNYCITISNISNSIYGHIIPYIQFQIMYDLQWKLRIPIASFPLSENERSRYMEGIKFLLGFINIDIICKQRNISLEEKICAISIKENKDISNDLYITDNTLYYKNNYIGDYNANRFFMLNTFTISNESVEIDGLLQFFTSQNFSICAIDELGQKINCLSSQNYKQKNNDILNSESFFNDKHFTIQLPLKTQKKKSIEYKFILTKNNNEFSNLIINSTAESCLNDFTKTHFFRTKKYLVTTKSNIIKFSPWSLSNLIYSTYLEFDLWKFLIKSKKRKAALARAIAWIKRKV